MNEEKEIKQRIVQKADELFRKFGFSKVTMEEISYELGISKKTLYKYFSNKEHVLKELIHTHKCEVDAFIEGLMSRQNITFIEKLKEFMNFIAKQAAKLEEPMVHDLMKSHPAIWCDIEEFRSKKAHKHLSKLIEDGIEDGIFRSDINNDVVVAAYVASIQSLLNPKVLAKLPVSADQAFRDILKILFEGIFTAAGRENYKSI
ncbi:MAG: transcriptional regulator TetR family [Ignavibacteria bacterium]|nr:MAG: transcriptional regulator TetR family [Ignavibacteria bacterium]KAF0161566.1 MAG: transcriptional regulator TetR family [Ignavibacteria bacterium]